MKFVGQIEEPTRYPNGDIKASFRVASAQRSSYYKVYNELINTPQNGNKGVTVSVDKYRKARSLDANAYFHVLVEKIAKVLNIGAEECKRQLNLDYGTMEKEADEQPWYMFLKKGSDPLKAHKYPKWIADRSLNGFELDAYILYKPTHELNTKEMGQLIDGVIFDAQELGIETKTPEQIAELLSAWGNK